MAKILKLALVLVTVLVLSEAAEIHNEIPPVPETPESPPEPEIFETSEGNNPGMQRYQNGDILFVSWVPYPIDKWDYVMLNMSDPEYIKESGRIDMASFTGDAFPDVKIVFACADGDRDYFYNYNLDVPVIGVDPFSHDGNFQAYLDSIYGIHGFQNLSEMWAHFARFQLAFFPVVSRLSQEFQPYLEAWKPRSEMETYSEIDPRNVQGRRLVKRRVEV